jgi:hypothetical protein
VIGSFAERTMATEDAHVESEPTAFGDHLAVRARDLASGGLVVLPVVLHLGSVRLLIRLHASRRPLSHVGRKAVRTARRINLVVLLVASACVAFLVAALTGNVPLLPSW